jgi:hypothetical protein
MPLFLSNVTGSPNCQSGVWQWVSGHLHSVILLLRLLSCWASAFRLGTIAAFVFLLGALFAFATGHNHVYNHPRPLKER